MYHLKNIVYGIQWKRLNKRLEVHFAIQNQGIRLMRLYVQQLTTLAKYKNKGKQTMEIKHIHVNKGGKAIVGNVNQEGGQGGDGKK